MSLSQRGRILLEQRGASWNRRHHNLHVYISTGKQIFLYRQDQRQTNAEGCRIFEDLDQLKSKDTIQKTVD